MSHKGIVYTETVVHAAPTRFLADAPYQLAIVDLDDGDGHTVRITVRILGERVRIGDRVEFAEERDGVAFLRKSA
jgi:uncharacterized OB-fold protein